MTTTWKSGGFEVCVRNIKTIPRREMRVSGAWYIGRPGPLGNPFELWEFGRGDSVDMYAVWLWLTLVSRERDAWLDMRNMEENLRKSGRLDISCWCAPEKCHGDPIAWNLLRRVSDKPISRIPTGKSDNTETGRKSLLF